MSTPTMDDAAKVLTDPTAYADDERLHTALTHLRANNPVAWVDNPPYRPFWAITKHADITAIERDNNLFLSEPRPLLVTAEADDFGKQQLETGTGLRTLIHMDDPHQQGARHRCGLVPPKGHARLEGERRPIGEALRRQDA
jgi:cytochrome P450